MQILNLNVHNLAEVILRHKPKSIRALGKSNMDMCLDVISLFLVDLQDFYNVKTRMGSNQIKDLAMMLYSDYNHFTLYDLGLCFKMAKTGKFGKVYDRLDGGIIFEWLIHYEMERTDRIVTIREQQDNIHKSGFTERSSETTYKQFLNKK